MNEVRKLFFKSYHSKFLWSSFMMASCSTNARSDGEKMNRLSKEKSSYLLQHACNPVDWYPWGKDAFEKAKKENKLIFLSVGYSTCHWCHVMERESFEDPAIGKILNDSFVSIKVDREERPDVDKIYMSFVQATTGSGGWPMSVWLTPDLKPIVGGTYFPPDDRYFGRPGFSSILKFVAGQWAKKPEEVINQGIALTDALMQASSVNSSITDAVLPDFDTIHRCHDMIASSFDPLWGGFGSAPKFPQPVNFDFMLRYAQFKEGVRQLAESKPVDMVAKTLKMMARGGIHDHISQGFHRYSTDKKWHVPHFEKMLYDQAQLAVSYSEMYQITKQQLYADIVDDILTYVSRDLSNEAGGFYSAEDADSLPSSSATEKHEGAFCVWTDDEIRNSLADPVLDRDDITVADIFCKHYNVNKGGNLDPYQDPHGELIDQNVLIVLGSVEETATAFKLSVEETSYVLNAARKKLYDIRQLRPKPHLDKKILTSWNGLMISGFAKAGATLNKDSYLERAVKAAEFTQKHMYRESDGSLFRSVYVNNDGVVQLPTPILGFADDYCFLINGLLDLYEATLDIRWVEWAVKLQDKFDSDFWDAVDYGYFTSHTSDDTIIMRLKEDQDGAEPSANSVAALNLVRLSTLLDNNDYYRERAKQVFMAFGKRLNKVPIILPKLMCAYMIYHQPPVQAPDIVDAQRIGLFVDYVRSFTKYDAYNVVLMPQGPKMAVTIAGSSTMFRVHLILVILGPLDHSGTKELLRAVHSVFLHNRVIIYVKDPSQGSFLGKHEALLKNLKLVDGAPTCYPCRNFTCSKPIQSGSDLLAFLTEEPGFVAPDTILKPESS